MSTKLYWNVKSPDYNMWDLFNNYGWPTTHGWIGVTTQSLNYGNMMDTQKFGEVNQVINPGNKAGASPIKVILYRGISRKLLPQTISGTINGIFNASRSALSNCYTRLYVYVIDVTGNPSVPPVLGYLLNAYDESPAGVSGTEWGTDGSLPHTLKTSVALSSLVIPSDGRQYRLAIEFGATCVTASGEFHALSRAGTRDDDFGPEDHYYEILPDHDGTTPVPYYKERASFWELSHDLLMGSSDYPYANHEPEAAIDVGLDPVSVSITGALLSNSLPGMTNRWYKYAGIVNKTVSALSHSSGAPGTDINNLFAYLEISPSIVGPPFTAVGGLPDSYDSNAKKPIMLSATSDRDLYFKIQLGSLVTTTFTIVNGPTDLIQPGDIVITGDREADSVYDPTLPGGDSPVWYTPDGAIRHVSEKIISTELGVSLASGKLGLVAWNSELIIYDKAPALTLLHRVPLTSFGDNYYSIEGIGTDFISFYLSVLWEDDLGTEFRSIYKVSDAGVVSPTSWSIPPEVEIGDGFYSFGVSRDSKILYGGDVVTDNVYRYNLETSTPLAPFTTIPTGGRVVNTFTLNDNTVVAGFRVNSHPGWIYHYSASGTVLHTYEITGSGFGLDHFIHESDDSSSKVWIWTQGTASSQPKNRLQLINFTDGTILKQFEVPKFAIGAGYYSSDGNPVRFGAPGSCPVIMTMIPYEPGEPGGGGGEPPPVQLNPPGLLKVVTDKPTDTIYTTGDPDVDSVTIPNPTFKTGLIP